MKISRGEDDADWDLVLLKSVTLDVRSWDPSLRPDEPFTYVDISSIDNQSCEIVDPKRLLGREAPSRARRPILEGDVLFSNVRTYLRNVAQVGGLPSPAVASTGFTLLRPTAAISSRYLFHLARSDFFISRVTPQQTGTHYPATSDRVVRDQFIPLPPRTVQDQLAELIDSIEAKRASASAHLGVTRQAIECFRQVVLASACSGSLTAEWRVSNGREPDSGQPAGWRNATVESLAADFPRAIQSGPFGSNLKHSEFQATGRLVIGIDNVLDGKFVLGSQHRISEPKFAELQKYEARPLDVLITVMATVGRVCVVPSDIEPSIITKHVYRITVDQRRVLPFFLMYALRGHPKVREQIHAQTRGQTRPGINGQIVKGLVIAVPPIDEQREIVARIDHLLALADVVRGRVEDASRRVDRSVQAVLAKAFRGDLSISQIDEGVAVEDRV
jgi:type I restriction enzyme S subunit